MATTTAQVPIGSGFGATSTTSDVMQGISLAGQTAIVTGGYSGLGLETARALSDAGATVIVPARDAAKARRNLQAVPRALLESLNLMDPASIDAFAARFLAAHASLDLLVNCAAVMAPPLTRDARGNESQLSTNHLGHFQLTARLWPALVGGEKARVVAVSSRGHRRAPVDFADMNFERRAYDRWNAYGQSKTANILFALALDRRSQTRGVRALSVHPGSIVTDLARHMSRDELRRRGAIDDQGRPVIDVPKGYKTPEQGAASIVWCATNPRLADIGGVYCEDCDIAELGPSDPNFPRGVDPWATNPESAERLWTMTEALTGVTFTT
ncbi:MAG TPA: oxidoreductase [Polyangia bacterium]|nr:oxidoreductase [Polyangia bacterium]